MKSLTARVDDNLNIKWVDIDGKIHCGKIYEVEDDTIHVREDNGTEYAWDLCSFLGKPI